MRKLGPQWQQIYQNASPEDRSDLWFVIQHHMNLDDTAGFQSKNLKTDLMDEQGRFRNERRVKLLLALVTMDRMGRGGNPDFSANQAKSFALNNTEPGQAGIEGMNASSKWMKDRVSRINAHQTGPSAADPRQFISDLRSKRESGHHYSDGREKQMAPDVS
jgi:hypothetical protein